MYKWLRMGANTNRFNSFVAKLLRNYSGQIIKGKKPVFGHCVVVVGMGYDEETKRHFWIVRRGFEAFLSNTNL